MVRPHLPRAEAARHANVFPLGKRLTQDTMRIDLIRRGYITEHALCAGKNRTGQQPLGDTPIGRGFFRPRLLHPLLQEKAA